MNTEHVTVRLPYPLVAELRAQAKRDRRSLAFVIAERLGYWAEIDSGLRQESYLDRKPQKVEAPQPAAVQEPRQAPVSQDSRTARHSLGCRCLMCQPPA